MYDGFATVMAYIATQEAELRGRLKEYEDSAESARTNYDHIKNMSIEEMAEYIHSISAAACIIDAECHMCPLENAGSCTKNDIKKWLESEAEDEK